VDLGRGVCVGFGSRIFDADQHDRDDEHPERIAPVQVGDHTWIAADVTLLRGVRVGSHCIVGTRSVLTTDLPDHTLAYGSPAVARGRVGDRSQAR
jgi:maltose O-acetyltransferase